MTFYEHKASEWFGYSADHFLEGLKGSKLDTKDLIIREAIQNSYDAAIDRSIRTVDFCIHGYDLKPNHIEFLERCFPQKTVAESFIHKIKEGPFCLEIRDGNTTGLSGDFYPHKDDNGQEIHTEESNYKNFVWSMGGDKQTDQGGAYGVGKSAYFLISKAKIICIYTRTIYEGKYQSRLIFKGFYRPSSDAKAIQYWYGDTPYRDTLDFVLPFLDQTADEIASSIGLVPYGSTETGTSILIFGVDFNDVEGVEDDPHTVFKESFPAIIQHWFWTKLSDECPFEKKINIHVFLENQEIPLEGYFESYSPFFYFERALENWREAFAKIKGMDRKEKFSYDFSSRNMIPIKCRKPEVLLGMVSFVTTDFTDEISQFFSKGDSKYNLCIAYMRDVEFVVKYKMLSYPQIPENKCVLAIFHTDPESSDGKEPVGSVDKAFRNSEDKTHEDWLPTNVSGRERTYVKRALDEISQCFEQKFGGLQIRISSNAAASKLVVSLGRLLPSKTGKGVAFGDSPVAKTAGKSSASSINQRASSSSNDVKELSFRDIRLRYTSKNIREVLCIYTPSQSSERLLELIPYVRTFDGNIVPNRRVKILGVYAVNGNGSLVRIDSNSLYVKFNKKCDYSFKFQVEGDVEFGCKARVIK